MYRVSGGSARYKWLCGAVYNGRGHRAGLCQQACYWRPLAAQVTAMPEVPVLGLLAMPARVELQGWQPGAAADRAVYWGDEPPGGVSLPLLPHMVECAVLALLAPSPAPPPVHGGEVAGGAGEDAQ